MGEVTLHVAADENNGDKVRSRRIETIATMCSGWVFS